MPTIHPSGTKPSATFEYMPDKAVQESRNVTIPLVVSGKNSNVAVGSVVRVQLFFANVWMLVSEVNFQSFPASEALITTSEATFEADSTTTVATVVEGHFGYDDYPDEMATGFEKELEQGGEGEGIDEGEI